MLWTQQILLVLIGDEIDRSVHDWPRMAGLAANATTGQFVQQHWSKDDDDHYRKQKPFSHRVSSSFGIVRSLGGWE